MSPKPLYNCRKCSLMLCFMLLLQFAQAQDRFAKVDAWLNRNVAGLGGRAVLLLYKDGIVYSKAVNNLSERQRRLARLLGKRDGNSDITADYTTSTRERIASCSKWLSAALVMTFIDQGSLTLEDSVGKFLPVTSTHGKGAIRIWQCLSHQTGIASGSLRESLEEMKDLKSMDEAMEKIAAMPMESAPGQSFHYSNVGLQIAAAVIEKISGEDFETLFAERIAGPCGMKHTDFGKVKVPLAAGGAFSTPEDYMKFLVMLLNKGLINHTRVLTPGSVAAMQKNYTQHAKIFYSPAEAGGWGYGFGEWVMSNGNNGIEGVSSPGLFGSFPWLDTVRGYAGILFCFNLNNNGRNERYTELKRLADEAISGK